MSYQQYQAASGGPGRPVNWTFSAKTGLDKALTPASEVTFTLCMGIVSEVYYPKEDIACVKQMSLLIANPGSNVIEEKELMHRDKMSATGVPAYKLTAIGKSFSIHKEIVTDPWRNSFLQRIKFSSHNKSLLNKLDGYSLYVVVYPGTGIFYGDIQPAAVSHAIVFIFYWKEVDRWENRDFTINLSL